MPRDFKYRELVTGIPKMGEMPLKELRSECLHSLVRAFMINLHRPAIFAAMPAHIAYQVRRDQLLSDCATFNLTGKLEPNLVQYLEGEPPEGYLSEFQRLGAEFFALNAAKKSEIVEGFGVGYIERLLDVNESMQNSIDATFESIVLQCWTAFECLAGDLWVAGVDNEPGEVAARLIYAGRRLRQPDDNIRPETVYRAGINPKTHYGSFLRAVKSVAFQTLPDIKNYYGIAFGSEFTNLFDATDNGYIEVLAAFRNAITHAAGRADKQFVARMSRFDEFKPIKEQDQLQLDGDLVLRLKNIAGSLGGALIKQMDDLLSPAGPVSDAGDAV